MAAKSNTKDFIKRAKKVHGKKYGYDKVQYVNSKTPVQIYCNTHKEYFWQTPSSHFNGSGCPACGKSLGYNQKYLTYALKDLLDLKNYTVSSEDRIKVSKSSHPLRVDIFVTNNSSGCSYAIEVHGEQHFKEIKYFHKEPGSFSKGKCRDRKKAKYLEKQGIKLYIEKDKDLQNFEDKRNNLIKYLKLTDPTSKKIKLLSNDRWYREFHGKIHSQISSNSERIINSKLKY